MIEPSFVEKWQQTAGAHLKFKIDSLMKSQKCYVLGRNPVSKYITDLFSIQGLVDDFSINKFWHCLPVIKASNLPYNSVVINCSNSVMPVDAANHIEALEGVNLLQYSDFYRVYPDKFILPKFVYDTREDFAKNKDKWEYTEKALCDEESIISLLDILKYRLTGDYNFMRNYSVRPAQQYFENFTEFSKDEVFVDAGGFTGDTTEQFCLRCPDFGKIYFFEPSSRNIEEAKKRLKTTEEIVYSEVGLSDSDGFLFFNPDKGSASSINLDGTGEKIKVSTLDHIVAEQVSFIKMDLEGWEIKALQGAREHILKDKPKLAISVYHFPSDIWKIFEFVKNINPDYKVYLRHYTQGWSETVMYFIP
ncbi:FkbM family methyltransferase [Sedimentisphaera salicampi]|uniref:FkbM family methyltransferase n=1 Tax=Sedimentisphaera salicampi TaxID=1941349 RepID=UPI000B9B8762|nr:FkbM family methyltransferase [Sedimentisphaera salicampi]OXU15579.1 methyltransferase, FkbM family [Sedimentisphaera salicampi]